MNEQHPSQPTLQDLVRPIAAHKWLLIAVIGVAVAASLVYSATQTTTYKATASVAVHDESRDLSLVGVPLAPSETPDQLAAETAQTIVQPSVARSVQRDVRSSESVSALTNSVTATVQTSSNLVEITASASKATTAQQLANAFAAEGANALNAQQRRLYTAALNDLKRRAPKQSNTPSAATAQQLYNEQASRLQLLSAIATPAQVVARASLPGSPTSPRPVRNGLLAAAFGLVLGLLIIYVRESFDRRLRTAHDVEEQLPLPMLGHVRVDALGRSPRVNGDRGVAPIDWELFRILRRNLDFLQEGDAGRIVAVTSSLPEEGKSTVAAFLAFVSAAAGKRTLLVECDMRRPVFADRLGVKKDPGLSDFLVGRARPDEVLQVVKFGDPMSPNGANRAVNGASKPSAIADGAEQHQHDLVCITAGTPTRHPVELIHSGALREMFTGVANAYDLVVLDTPPVLSVVDTLELLPEADAAIVCVRVHQTTRQQAKAGMAALARLPTRPTGLVVTGTRPTHDAEYGYYGYYAYQE
jgi:Mrp family chromosome partitioning ATPase/capsular polysaccharide biosynthesis protein